MKIFQLHFWTQLKQRSNVKWWMIKKNEKSCGALKFTNQFWDQTLSVYFHIMFRNQKPRDTN